MDKELNIKENLIFNELTKNNWKALIISRQNLFSWLTGGLENRVVNQSLFGNSHIILTRNKKKYIPATPGEMDLVYNKKTYKTRIN